MSSAGKRSAGRAAWRNRAPARPRPGREAVSLKSALACCDSSRVSGELDWSPGPIAWAGPLPFLSSIPSACEFRFCCFLEVCRGGVAGPSDSELLNGGKSFSVKTGCSRGDGIETGVDLTVGTAVAWPCTVGLWLNPLPSVLTLLASESLPLSRSVWRSLSTDAETGLEEARTGLGGAGTGSLRSNCLSFTRPFLLWYSCANWSPSYQAARLASTSSGTPSFASSWKSPSYLLERCL